MELFDLDQETFQIDTTVVSRLNRKEGVIIAIAYYKYCSPQALVYDREKDTSSWMDIQSIGIKPVTVESVLVA